WYTKAAEQGFAWAQNNLGSMYDNGEGTAVDKNQAFYWYTKAAEQGVAEAQYNLGRMYSNGEGTSR
ncbi:tetratricopeptide repeat protein, partial [Treponema phagedenis]